MPARKEICVFFAGSTILFSTMLTLWPYVGKTYADLFQRAGNCLAGGDYPRQIEYSRLMDTQGNHDTGLTVADRKGRVLKVELSSRGHGFMPTAFVLALTLAAPIPWNRRFVAGLWGLFWVNAYIVLQLALFPLAYGIEGSAESSRYFAILNGALRQGLWVIGNASVGWTIIPLIIWASIVLRSPNPPSTDLAHHDLVCQ